MKCYLGIFVLFLGAKLCQAQTSIKTVSSLYAGTTTYSSLQTDVFCFTNNKAALAQVSAFGAGIYSEQRFSLKELSLFNGVVALPSASGNFGLHTQYFGNSRHSQMLFGLAYGRKLGAKADIGGQFNYTSIQTAGYGKGATATIDAGIIFHFTEQLHGGFQLSNPFSMTIGKSGERLASVYCTGLGYDASEKAFLAMEIEKIENEELNVIGRLQYQFDKRLIARGGISTLNASFYLGFGVLLNNIRIDVTGTVHQQLGFTPGLQLIFQSLSSK